MAANVSQVAGAKMATVAPSLIAMSNGGLMRNFMGSTPNDSHLFRLWGTKAADRTKFQTSDLLRCATRGGKIGLRRLPTIGAADRFRRRWIATSSPTSPMSCPPSLTFTQPVLALPQTYLQWRTILRTRRPHARSWRIPSAAEKRCGVFSSRAREIRSFAPNSDGAQMINEMLHLGEADRSETDAFAAEVSAVAERLNSREHA